MQLHNRRAGACSHLKQERTKRREQAPPYRKGEIIIDFYKVSIGFSMALAQNEAAMIRYGLLSEVAKHDLLTHARGVRNEMEMYKLVASFAGGTMQ